MRCSRPRAEGCSRVSVRSCSRVAPTFRGEWGAFARAPWPLALADEGPGRPTRGRVTAIRWAPALALAGVKVVATIGPACHSVEQLGELLDSGTVGARFDLTWGPLDFHRASLANLQVRSPPALQVTQVGLER